MEELQFVRKYGREILSVFKDLAALRIKVFRDFPYLYEGSSEYEEEYLQTYANAEGSMLFAVYDKENMVGATTCIPLENETENTQAPFVQSGYNPKDFFYFGESILLPEYRGKGLGHRFFDEREQHARSFGRFNYSCFLSVNREENHPFRPPDYRPNDLFWQKRGYKKYPELQAVFHWPDIGTSSSTAKTLVAWIKNL